ncbi:MAG: ABC transporter substrate-binding protein [Desulfobacterales bacterium]|nr:ABC transporter substrate-binding protein [Desulfobacterales bacterium]
MNSTRLYRTIYIALLLLLISSQSVLAENVIVVGFPEEEAIPYLIKEGEKTHKGIVMDIFLRIVVSMDYGIIVKRQAESNGLKLLSKGEIDAWPKSKELMPYPGRFLWTDSIIDASQVLLTLKANSIKYSKPEDLIGKKIGIRKFSEYPAFNSFIKDKKITINEVETDQALVDMVLKQKADAAIINTYSAKWFINVLKADERQFEFSKIPITKAGFHYMFSNKTKWASFVAKFNSVLREMIKNEEVKDIIKKYVH